MRAPAVAEKTAALTYPYAAPAPGGFVDIGEGVRWLRMPLPSSLDHINLYLIKDGGGWTLVDTGLGDEATEQHWCAAIADALDGSAITRVICTHMHPDHTGMAGWVCERFDAPLWMSRLEYVTARMLIADAPPAPQAALDFYRAAGWSDEQLDRYKSRFGMFGKVVRRLPDAYMRIEDRDDIVIGDHTWRVITGEGHSPEHVCLWQPETRLFISGDQVLPRISSNISVWPTEPGADPLSDWLNSCWRLMAAIPDDVLVLPSHNEPFHGLHARLEALINGHEDALDALTAALVEPRRVIDVFPVLFKREVTGGLLSMATGESVAHLNYLLRNGAAACSLGDDGVAWFKRAETPERDD